MFQLEISVYFFNNVTAAERNGGIVIQFIFTWIFFLSST